MAAGGRSSGGERVVEGRHVIGLFVLMLLFSAVFFSLGYVMGRSQYASLVPGAPDSRAAEIKNASRPSSQPDVRPKRSAKAEPEPDGAAPPASDWEFYHAGEPNKPKEEEKAAEPAAKPVSASARPAAAPKAVPPKGKTASASQPPAVPKGAYVLQVAAFKKGAEAFALAETLQRKSFPAFVSSPGTENVYRVQVGPFADAQSAAISKKKLDDAGFRAIVKH